MAKTADLNKTKDRPLVVLLRYLIDEKLMGTFSCLIDACDLELLSNFPAFPFLVASLLPLCS